MKVKKALVIAYAAALVALPAAAFAAVSTEGSDYSEDYRPLFSDRYIKTCDMESDSRHVYAEYQITTGEWSEVTDGNGANNSCAERGPYAGITQHRTCEAIDFWPDACGSFVFP